MKCRFICVALAVCLLAVSGCSFGKEQTTYVPEDTEGTTRRTQEAVLSTALNYYKENGYIYFNPDIPDYKQTFVSFLQLMEQEDTGLSFDYDSIAASFTGYNVQLLTPLDAWGRQMTIWFDMPDAAAGQYCISIASMGSDGEMQYLGTYDITSGESGDDIFSYKEGTAE